MHFLEGEELLVQQRLTAGARELPRRHVRIAVVVAQSLVVRRLALFAEVATARLAPVKGVEGEQLRELQIIGDASGVLEALVQVVEAARKTKTGGYAAWWFGRKGMKDEGIVYADPAASTAVLVPVIEKNNGLEFGQSRVLFGGHNFSDANAGAFSPDFKKMLVSLSTKSESANSLVMVNNWRSELAK